MRSTPWACCSQRGVRARYRSRFLSPVLSIGFERAPPEGREPHCSKGPRMMVQRTLPETHQRSQRTRPSAHRPPGTIHGWPRWRTGTAKRFGRWCGNSSSRARTGRGTFRWKRSEFDSCFGRWTEHGQRGRNCRQGWKTSRRGWHPEHQRAMPQHRTRVIVNGGPLYRPS